jgi:hypothetical protein
VKGNVLLFNLLGLETNIFLRGVHFGGVRTGKGLKRPSLDLDGSAGDNGKLAERLENCSERLLGLEQVRMCAAIRLASPPVVLRFQLTPPILAFPSPQYAVRISPSYRCSKLSLQQR